MSYGYWILTKQCGCPVIAIADGCLYAEATLAKVLTPIITQSPTHLTHQTTEEPITVYTQCPHEIKQLEFEETRLQTLREGRLTKTGETILADLDAYNKRFPPVTDPTSGEIRPSAAVQVIAADLQQKIDADHDQAKADNARWDYLHGNRTLNVETQDEAWDAADALLDEYDELNLTAAAALEEYATHQTEANHA